MSTKLPPPSKSQNYVTVSALTGGFITLGDRFFVAPADPEAKRTVPSLCFLVTHPNPPNATFGTKRKPLRMLFDLGLRSSKERYPTALQRHIEGRAPFTLEPGVIEQLGKGGLTVSDIDVVMLSHVHYDHHGDPEDFPSSTFVVGHGVLDVIAHGLQGQGSHQHFQSDLFRHNTVFELPPAGLHAEINGMDLEWKPIGPFPAALDLFKDGSVFVIDTPGHLPGHINLLCRIGPEKWVCLCGDAFHDLRLLTGEKEIGTWEGADGNTLCIHLDKEGAKESIGRLRQLQEIGEGKVELIAAHDEKWLKENKKSLLPGMVE